MLFAVSLTIAAAVVSAATPPQPPAGSVHLPLKRITKVKSAKTIIEKGRARIKHCNANRPVASTKVVGSSAATNLDNTYYVPVTIGSNTWKLLIDTGSSNTWCGVVKPCEPTSSGKSTNATIQVNYGSGAMTGFEYTDRVSFGGLTVPSQSIGAANASVGFDFGVDGLIGFGPVGLTRQTVSNVNTVPTFMNNLYRQGTIPAEVLGVYFKPEAGSDMNDTNVLATGGTGFVDTGTTFIYIPTAAYNQFIALTGGQTEDGTAVFTKMPTADFGFTFGSTTYTLTPGQYLVPEAQYVVWGFTPGRYYAWISDGGTQDGVNTVIGQKFLENYYSVFDTAHSRIGFATAR